MSSLTPDAVTAPRPPATSGEPADPTARVRRIAGAAALVVAPLGPLLANTGYAWATRHGGSDATGAEALALATGNTTLLRVVLVAALVGCLLLVPAVIAGMRLTRPRAPWLSLTGGSLMIGGYVCYFGVVMTNFDVLAMVEVGGPDGTFARVLDASSADPATLWVFLLFVVGNLLGTALFGVALLRSRAVPVLAAIGVLAWPVLHVTGLVAGSEWFEVTGAALQAAGMTVTAVVYYLRTRALP